MPRFIRAVTRVAVSENWSYVIYAPPGISPRPPEAAVVKRAPVSPAATGVRAHRQAVRLSQFPSLLQTRAVSPERSL